MNHDFEERLRTLRPGSLPDELASRLSQPPAAPARRPPSTRILLASAAAAAAAGLVVITWSARTSLPAAKPAAEALPSFAGQRRTEVTGVHPVSVVTDESNQPWRLVEVNWVEEDTYVYAGHPAAIRTRDQYHAIVPVAVHFD